MQQGISSLHKPTSFAIVLGLLFAMLEAAPAQNSTSESNGKARDRIVLSQALPKLDGENLKVTVVEVIYGPGESSSPHSHPCPVVGYVVEGALRVKVKGESETIYKAGESFYESPHGVHEVSANASKTRPAKFIAYFVCDREVPLSVAPPTSKEGEQP